MALLEGAVVAGRFRLNRLLGRGGMGSVWHATHLGLDVPCAVKFIEGEYALHPEAQARFEREAKAAAQLMSPHVVSILDHGLSDNGPYIAMELLQGEDLGKRLTRVGRLSPAETSAIIQQVCRALAKAHGMGIVHRDLKPDNIYLVLDDDREIAKVLDFGIAKKDGGIEGSKTKTGAMLGTPYYMSPEQAQGTKAVDHRSDLWSMAVIAFQCVTGVLPFESEALGDLLLKILVQDLPVPSHFASVPVGFDAWWAKAASRKPEERFQSAKELADSLHGVLVGAADPLGQSPAAMGAQLGVTPRAGSSPHLAMTPQPAAGGGGPFPHGMTPRPGSGPPSALAQSVAAVGGGGPQGTTGAPVAQTFGGVDETPLAAKKKGASPVLLGAVAVLVLGGVVGAFALRSGKDPKGNATAGASSATTVTEPPKAAVEPDKSATPAPTPPASASAPPTAAAAEPPPEPVATTKKGRDHGSKTTKTATSSAAVQTPPPPPPPASAKPAASFNPFGGR